MKQTNNSTGYGNIAANYGGRLMNKDGTPNIRKIGIPFFRRFSIFHTLLTMPLWKFIGIIFLFYTILNVIFASIYYTIGIEHLTGMHSTSFFGQFAECFFFSAQTLTTVGYGRVAPTGLATNIVSSLQALLGLLAFALVTGLLYARFSLPKAFIKFSKNAVIAPYQGGTGLMVRLANYKDTASLTEVEAKISIALIENINGKPTNQFYNVSLETHKINALALSWTLVHPINEDSPLFGFTGEDYQTRLGEILVYIRAFDETFSNSVLARRSYTFHEVLYGHKFTPMYVRDDTAHTTIVDHAKLSHTDAVELPLVAIANESN
jgi:inward rectifier potassium channel